MLNREYPSPEQLHHLYLLLFLGLIVITFTHSQKQSPSTLHSLLSVTNQYHILHLFFSFFFFFPTLSPLHRVGYASVTCYWSLSSSATTSDVHRAEAQHHSRWWLPLLLVLALVFPPPLQRIPCSVSCSFAPVYFWWTPVSSVGVFLPLQLAPARLQVSGRRFVPWLSCFSILLGIWLI